jgi:mRNA-degrading endonuclease RelE of RelBE toxin-antitoxin system
MNIIETEDFKKDFKDLPISIRKLYQKQKAIFKQNWLDPRLHTKRIKELTGVYSFRITRRYRVFFILEMMILYFSKSVTEKIFINKPDSKFRHLVFTLRL